jgi:hypothetical protein
VDVSSCGTTRRSTVCAPSQRSIREPVRPCAACSNPRSSQGSNGRCGMCGTLLCAGNIHLSGGRAGQRRRSVLGRGNEGQGPGAVVAIRQRAASSSILQALPTRPSRQSEMVGLEQVTARSTRPGRSVTQIPGECHGSSCPTERNAEAPCAGPRAEPGLHVSWAPSPLSAVLERALQLLHSSHWPPRGETPS